MTMIEVAYQPVIWPIVACLTRGGSVTYGIVSYGIVSY
jgi:hypothetical protein